MRSDEQRGDDAVRVVNVADGGLHPRSNGGRTDNAELAILPAVPIFGEGRQAHSAARPSAQAASVSDDPIIINRDQYDPAGMERYERARRYQAQHGCSFEEALERSPTGDRIIANRAQYDPDGMDRYERILRYQAAHGCSFGEAMTACG